MTVDFLAWLVSLLALAAVVTPDLVESLHEKLDSLLADPGRQRWLSAEEAANYSRLSVESIRRLLSGGKLTSHRPVRGRVLVDRLELDALIQSSTATPRTGRGR
jgi:excisionase family DNA binding protein